MVFGEETGEVKTFYLEDKLFSCILNKEKILYILPPLNKWNAFTSLVTSECLLII